MSLPFAVVGQSAVDVVYLIAAIGFILGIRRLASATTARSGNILAGGGMLLAILFTLLRDGMTNWELIFPALAVGAVIGLFTARLVKMTAMPQMVAIFNGLGGGAAVLVALSEYQRFAPDAGALDGDVLAASLFSALIGAVTFSGSVIAFGKLQELLPGAPTVFPRQQFLNGSAFGLAVAFAIVAGITEDGLWISFVIVVALALGVLFVLPIGGADMPVVIAFLNAFSGLSAVSAGFVLSNNALIIGGTLVGASGTLLTLLMARAMNRSVVNVLFGAFGQVQEAADATDDDGGTGARDDHR